MVLRSALDGAARAVLELSGILVGDAAWAFLEAKLAVRCNLGRARGSEGLRGDIVNW